MAARPADDLAEHHRQPRRAARLAAVELDGPVGALLLARRAHEHLTAIDGGADPRALPLVGIEGGSAAEQAAGAWGGRLGRVHDAKAYPDRD